MLMARDLRIVQDRKKPTRWRRARRRAVIVRKRRDQEWADLWSGVKPLISPRSLHELNRLTEKLLRIQISKATGRAEMLPVEWSLS